MTTAKSAPSWPRAPPATFSFTQWVEGDYSGPAHINVFTAKAIDNDNTEATDTDDATVDFTNVLPTIEVTKTADPTAVPETGGNVTFTFVVKNTSSEEPVTITSLERQRVRHARWRRQLQGRHRPGGGRVLHILLHPVGRRRLQRARITSTSSRPRRSTTTTPRRQITTMPRWTSPMSCRPSRSPRRPTRPPCRRPAAM